MCKPHNLAVAYQSINDVYFRKRPILSNKFMLCLVNPIFLQITKIFTNITKYKGNTNIADWNVCQRAHISTAVIYSFPGAC